MLPKQNRVSEKEVALLFKKAKSVRTPFFVARYLPDSRFKCAIIAPKTIAKTAVLRNSLRRKWYGSLHTAIKDVQPKLGVYAFVLVQEAVKTSPEDRVRTLASFFKQFNA